MPSAVLSKFRKVDIYVRRSRCGSTDALSCRTRTASASTRHLRPRRARCASATASRSPTDGVCATTASGRGQVRSAAHDGDLTSAQRTAGALRSPRGQIDALAPLHGSYAGDPSASTRAPPSAVVYARCAAELPVLDRRLTPPARAVADCELISYALLNSVVSSSSRQRKLRALNESRPDDQREKTLLRRLCGLAKPSARARSYRLRSWSCGNAAFDDLALSDTSRSTFLLSLGAYDCGCGECREGR